jgi:signal transduction histidine kinase
LHECADSYPQLRCEAAAPVWARIERPRIREVIERLVQNGLRHSGSEVSLKLLAAETEATVVVADSGRGIPPDKLEVIFDEFEQLSTGPGRTVGGVGLGLPIVKLIVEQHRGKVWAESQPGRGSRFCFTLKTCPAPVEKSHDNRDAG